MAVNSDTIGELFHSRMSKKEAILVAGLFVQKPEQIAELLDFLRSDEPVSTPQASWILGTIWETEPSLIADYQQDMIQIVLNTQFDSVRRNLQRIIEYFPIPEDDLGTLFDRCLSWYISENNAPAVRVNALQVLYRISCAEPLLTGEVIAQIEMMDDYGSPALKARSRMVLKKMMKLKYS